MVVLLRSLSKGAKMPRAGGWVVRHRAVGRDGLMADSRRWFASHALGDCSCTMDFQKKGKMLQWRFGEEGEGCASPALLRRSFDYYGKVVDGTGHAHLIRRTCAGGLFCRQKRGVVENGFFGLQVVQTFSLGRSSQSHSQVGHRRDGAGEDLLGRYSVPAVCNLTLQTAREGPLQRSY